MESTSTDRGNDAIKGESTSQYTIGSLESNGETLVLKKGQRKLKPKRTLILDVQRSRANASSNEFFLRSIHGLHNSIPKHITTFDQKYILRCLQSIHNCALRAAEWNFASKVNNFPDAVSDLAVIKSSNNMLRSAIEYPLVGRTEGTMNSYNDWTLGTLSGSQSMINILKSPLLRQFVPLDCEVNVRRTDLPDLCHSDFTDSKQESSSSSSSEKEVKILDHKCIFEPVHERDASTSSTNSTCSDQSSYSANGSSFGGMLQCTWKNGLLHHVFTVDDKKKVYVAKLSKVGSSGGKKGPDYVYTFHSSSNCKKECDTHESELESIAKMLVSTSIKFSYNSPEIRETRFILSVSSDNQMESSSHAVRKNKRLRKKVADIFKSTNFSKQKFISRLGGSSSVLEDTGSDPCEDVYNNYYLDLAPNFELAAIIVREICENRKEAELGGWGLKFLKRQPLETFVSSECSRDSGKCSTSMDVIIPAGFHGGPRTRVGGPSGLTERWMSGGGCDCGGWDIGCPLTVLKSGSSGTDYYSPWVDNYGECKSVDLFMQGSKQNAPIMKLVSFHEGLYYIHFQSTLSSLQSFAIAAAIIHSNSPALRSKVYRS